MSDFFGTVAIIVVHTPLWVWPLYVLLLFLGFQRSRDRTVPLWRELILPLVVAFLAVLTLAGAGMGGVLPMLLGFVGGGLFGWWLEPADATRRLANGSLRLRGEWWSLAQIIVVLVFRYATSIIAAMDPALNANAAWHVGTLFVSAALSASFLGRTAKRLQTYAASVAPLKAS